MSDVCKVYPSEERFEVAGLKTGLIQLYKLVSTVNSSHLYRLDRETNSSFFMNFALLNYKTVKASVCLAKDLKKFLLS